MQSTFNTASRSVLLLILCCLTTTLFSQIRVYQTFKDTRVINTQSVETTPKRKLDIRIAHRFGDIAGESGGWQTFYGLETAADVSIGANYGITNNIDIGLNRAAGAGPLKQLVNLSLKYRLMHQTEEDGSPFSLVFYGVSAMSTMKKSENPTAINNFGQFSHRLNHHLSILLGRKFSEYVSIQFGVGYTHRNLVPFNDENSVMNASVAGRIQLTKMFGLIADFTLPFSDLRTPENGYYPPLGIGLEIETGGHVFQVNFTNATGIMETDYIPHTRSKWSDGEYRLGFTISRLFNL